MPALHEVQMADVEPAATLPYLPARHTVQDEVPKTSELYVPAMHAVHTVEVLLAATLPKVPAKHAVHTTDELAVPTLPYLPARQAVHAEVPVASAL